MFDPNFDPLAELEHHTVVLHHLKRQNDAFIVELQRLNGLIQEMSANQLSVTELLVKNQNALKYLGEAIQDVETRLDAIN
jgi:hypothetical protein